MCARERKQWQQRHQAEFFCRLFPPTRRDSVRVRQPRARLEDLIISHGISTATLLSDSTLDSSASTEIRASDITLSLTLKQITLLLPFQSPNNAKSSIRKAVLTLDRRRGVTLESSAEEALRRFQDLNLKQCKSADGKRVWYEMARAPNVREVGDAVPAYSEVNPNKTVASSVDPDRTSKRSKFTSWIKKL